MASSSGKVVRPFAFFRAGNAAHSNPNNRPILVLEDVYKYFRPDVPTLRGVNLTVERGEFVFVTGPSGAGKSTLLQLIYRAQTVDEGRILFCGRDIARLTLEVDPVLAPQPGDRLPGLQDHPALDGVREHRGRPRDPQRCRTGWSARA